MASAAAEPWEQQPDEAPTAFAAFAQYRDMTGRRSLAKVGRQLGKSTTLLERWSMQHCWQSRVRAWDREQDRVRRTASLEAVAKMSERHATLALGLISKLSKRIKDLNPAEIAAEDIPRLFDVAVKVERLARGVPANALALTGKDGGAIEHEHEHDLADDAEQRLALLLGGIVARNQTG